jgi:hypothetical protein
MFILEFLDLLREGIRGGLRACSRLIGHCLRREPHERGVDPLMASELCLQIAFHTIQRLQCHPGVPRPRLQVVNGHVTGVGAEFCQIVADLYDLVRHEKANIFLQHIK